MTKLLGLQYHIIYKPGTTNRAADTRSRKEKGDEGEIVVTSTVVPDWMEAIEAGYQHDPQASKFLKDLMVSRMAHLSFN